MGAEEEGLRHREHWRLVGEGPAANLNMDKAADVAVREDDMTIDV